MGRGIIRLDVRLLPELLKLPEEYKAVNVWCHDSGDLRIIVDHPDIPEVEEAEPFPTLQIQYETKHISISEMKKVEIQRYTKTNETVEETMARLGIKKRENHG